MNAILRRTRSEHGTALVELAVALPMLIAVLLGTADFARVFYYAMELTTAARAGAQYATYNVVYATQRTQIIAAAQNAAPNISPITVNVATPPSVCRCALNDGTGQPWAAVACTSTCASGHMIETVTVTTQKTFTLISRFLPISPTMTLTRTATMRVAL
jgi:Flp pilus assembly protein TadG